MNPQWITQRNSLSTSVISPEKLWTRSYFWVWISSRGSDIISTHITDWWTVPDYNYTRKEKNNILDPNDLLKWGANWHHNFYNEVLVGNSGTLKAEFLRVKTIDWKPMVSDHIYSHLQWLSQTYWLELIHIEQTNYPKKYANKPFTVENTEDTIDISMTTNGVQFKVYVVKYSTWKSSYTFRKTDPSWTDWILSLQEVQKIKENLWMHKSISTDPKLHDLYENLINVYQANHLKKLWPDYQVSIRLPWWTQAAVSIHPDNWISVHELDVNGRQSLQWRMITLQEKQHLLIVIEQVSWWWTDLYTEYSIAVEQARKESEQQKEQWMYLHPMSTSYHIIQWFGRDLWLNPYELNRSSKESIRTEIVWIIRSQTSLRPRQHLVNNPNFQESVKRIFTLQNNKQWIAIRVELAWFFLWRELNETEKRALIEANAMDDNSQTLSRLKRGNTFTYEQARVLVELGICGKSKDNTESTQWDQEKNESPN